MTEDETILQSLVRKVAEETRMRVNHIFRRVQEIVYLTVRGVRWAKLCFLVGVDEVTGQEPIQNVPVRIVRSSHRAARWASRNEIEELEVMTEGQRGVMRSGFDAFAEWCAEGNRELGERLVLLYL
jgi:ADP-ribose pyrophosphatase YjhB (NUDIX family)